ncbi:unnamed protein product [Musa hybrid cultivar]
MGGHGGLNILPQKRWNVYNYENREKVRRDEEAAAREEQLQREESRRRVPPRAPPPCPRSSLPATPPPSMTTLATLTSSTDSPISPPLAAPRTKGSPVMARYLGRRRLKTVDPRALRSRGERTIRRRWRPRTRSISWDMDW